MLANSQTRRKGMHIQSYSLKKEPYADAPIAEEEFSIDERYERRVKVLLLFFLPTDPIQAG